VVRDDERGDRRRHAQAFAEADHFGLPARDVFFLRQGMITSFDFEGRLILERPDRIFVNPDGHGGSLTALLDSGALDDMERRGITTIFYYQVDNPLISIGDPVFLGFHARAGAEFSCKSLRKREPGEKMGVFARIDGRIGVVEYTEITDEQRDARDSEGRLVFDAGNLAVHAFDVEFVRGVAADAERWLPWHASAKKIPTVDANGAAVEPDEPNGYKLERFVFDALRAARTVCIVETGREEYGPVKNATGNDSPLSSRRSLSAHYRRWIEDGGPARAEPRPSHRDRRSADQRSRRSARAGRRRDRGRARNHRHPPRRRRMTPARTKKKTVKKKPSTKKKSAPKKKPPVAKKAPVKTAKPDKKAKPDAKAAKPDAKKAAGGEGGGAVPRDLALAAQAERFGAQEARAEEGAQGTAESRARARQAPRSAAAHARRAPGRRGRRARREICLLFVRREVLRPRQAGAAVSEVRRRSTHGAAPDQGARHAGAGGGAGRAAGQAVATARR
jgi:hypothetical protein